MSIIQLTGAGSDWPATPAADPYSANLILALPLNSSYGIRDQSAKIRGSGSSYGLSTFAGSIDETISKFYGSSHLVGSPSGSTGRLFTTSAIPAFGSSDFCIEGNVFVPTLGTGNFALFYNHNDTNAGFQALFLGSSATPSRAIYFAGGAGSDNAHTGTSSCPINQWFHFAVTRQGSTLRVFIKGASSLVYGGSITNNYSGSFGVNIANGGDTTYNTVRLQDFRVYQGTAKYTSNFTPPGAMFV